MDFIEYKRFAAFFKPGYDKKTKIMVIIGVVLTIVGAIPALLGFVRVNTFRDLKLYFLAVAIVGIVVWGMGASRKVKDFEFDDIFYRVNREVKDLCESKFGYADDLKNATMFSGFVIDDSNIKSARKFGNVCVSPLARVCYVYSRKEKLYTFTRTFSITENFCEDKEADVHFSSVDDAKYVTQKYSEDITTNKIVIDAEKRNILEAYVLTSDYDSEVFAENILHKKAHILSRM